MSLPFSAPAGSVRALSERLERVSDVRLFGFCVAWVIVWGLVLQLIVLPFLIPQAHWGHGLIAQQDSIGFHNDAVDIANDIRLHGWTSWRPAEISSSIALASALYAVTYPEPWVVLPINGILFAIAIVAVRATLSIIFDSRATGLAALFPFFVFPSFVPIFGQLHRDLVAGAGLSLVLCALVLAGRKTRGFPGFIACASIALAGMALLGLSREYAMVLIAGATIGFLAVAILSRRLERLRTAAVAVVVLLAAASTVLDWTTRMPVPAATSEPPGSVEQPSSLSPGLPTTHSQAADRAAANAWSWLPRIRRVDPSVPRGENCLPGPAAGSVIDGLLYNLCYVREGFVVDSTRFGAGSGYDYDIRLRTLGDFVAYSPIALERAFLEPAPHRWMRGETPIGRLARYLVPFEMLVAYGCFLLAAIFAWRRLAHMHVWAPVLFCVIYALFYALATAQLGTLYRMRAFAFAITVSIALAAVVEQLRTAE